MTDIALLLDDYPALSPDERAAVDARVAGRPEWAEAHAEARRLAAFVDAATDRDDRPERAVARRFGSPLLDSASGERAEGDDAIDARLDAIAAEAEDPLRRYERLTGHVLGDTPAPGGDSASGPLTLLEPAPARPRLRLVRASTWAAAAAVLLGAYGGLFTVSAALVPERAQVAALGEIEADPPPVLRGDEAVPEADRLAAALGAVDEARRSTLGLFPTYDAATLDAAAAEIEAVVEEADATSWASQEARLALGRILLYRGRDAEAVRVLGTLVEQGSYRGADARRLLDFVRRDGA
ncbi:hypothetical protein [Rubrivirga marina]|uniref:Uncharacterized protein n=1 Tax=Rubrivirga marina TaxID=1196024 RepID=A0A271J021_9BACT|nr:hypothetical protein [Rubrivirga marina]PAP76089.1 hypothetical protein BSZ37_06340 [Rubrivirga marina]